ncbi:MAG TPA: choice-of-anchor D domain-containing protein [Terriglobia bacterium]|nr:choice-of-anchor D domain-containing protein [Terriglobia bacterium]
MNFVGSLQRFLTAKLVFSVVALVFALWFRPPNAAAQIAMVNVTSCGPGSFPATCTIPSTGAGDLLVVGWTGSSGPSTLKSISDNVSNGYAEAKGTKAGNWHAGVSVDIWYAANSKAGATSLTVTPTPSGAQGAAVIWEFSGVSTTSPLAQAGALINQPVTKTPVGPSVTTTSAGEVIISIAAGSKSITGIYSGNPFTEDSLVHSDGWAHLIASSPGGYDAQWNESPSGAYCASAAAFLSATGGLTYLLTASPSSLAFGNVMIGSCGTLTATLSNTGTGSVTLNSISATGAGFSPGGPSLPFTLAAGYSTPLNVTFCPTTGASVTGTATVVSTASDSPTVVSLSGTGQHNVALTWTASTSSGVTGYDVYRNTSGGAYTQIGSASGTTYTDTTVSAGQTYNYQVTAVTSSGQSAPASLPGPVTISSP